MKKLLFLLLFPITFFAQNKEIVTYVERINDTLLNSTEGTIEGPLINKFSKNGGWKIYFVKDEKEKKSPLRIRFLTNESDKNTELKLYYRKDKLVFAELTIIFTSGKMKNEVSYKRQFSLAENEPKWQTENKNEDFKKVDNKYGFKYLFSQDKLVRNIVNR